jgi:DNA-binding transcriptional LysR family regulator
LSEERFRVTMTDHACVVVLPDLVRRVAGAASKSRLEVVPWSDARFEDVEAGRLDLVLTWPVRRHSPRTMARLQAAPALLDRKRIVVRDPRHTNLHWAGLARALQ